MKCKKTKTKYVLAAAACAVSLDPRAYATNYTYVGPNNGSFITDGTSPWSPASFPSSGDNVYVGLAEPADDSMTVNFNYGSGSFFYPDGGFSLVNIDPPNSSVMQIAEGPTAGGEATLETASLNISYNGSWVQGGTGETQNTVTGSLTLAGEYSLLRGSLSVGAAERSPRARSASTTAIITSPQGPSPPVRCSWRRYPQPRNSTRPEGQSPSDRLPPAGFSMSFSTTCIPSAT